MESRDGDETFEISPPQIFHHKIKLGQLLFLDAIASLDFGYESYRIILDIWSCYLVLIIKLKGLGSYVPQAN